MQDWRRTPIETQLFNKYPFMLLTKTITNISIVSENFVVIEYDE